MSLALRSDAHVARADMALIARDDALAELVRAAVFDRGLSDEAETAIKRALVSHVDSLLHRTDSAVVAQIELEAIERRLANHLRTHPGCSPCEAFRLLDARRRRHLQRSQRAYSDLVKGHRR